MLIILALYVVFAFALLMVGRNLEHAYFELRKIRKIIEGKK